MNPEDFLRLTNNFYVRKGLETKIERVNLDADLINYFNQNQKLVAKKLKVAFVYICLNAIYWEYAPTMVAGARQLFLPGHNKDFFFWTDIPENPFEINYKISEGWKARGRNMTDPNMQTLLQNTTTNVSALIGQKDVKIFTTESVDWPYPTLLRYNLFLQQEEKLKEYDYIFYCDIDMQFVSVVGDEILGDLVAVQQPMYATRKEYWPPYEPNPNSASYIKRPGDLIKDGEKTRFRPLYFAGGFQGGKSDKFIKAMKGCKKLIDSDLNHNYIPVWNDETVWNKYLSTNPPDIVLDPGYTYPDSLIEEYFKPMWGRDYIPKLKTLTKWFTVSKEGGDAVAKMLNK